jgi:hypothetical protein
VGVASAWIGGRETCSAPGWSLLHRPQVPCLEALSLATLPTESGTAGHADKEPTGGATGRATVPAWPTTTATARTRPCRRTSVRIASPPAPPHRRVNSTARGARPACTRPRMPGISRGDRTYSVSSPPPPRHRVGLATRGLAGPATGCACRDLHGGRGDPRAASDGGGEGNGGVVGEEQPSTASPGSGRNAPLLRPHRSSRHQGREVRRR